MAFVAGTLAVVKRLGPGTVRYRSGGELVKALAQELRTGVAQAMGEGSVLRVPQKEEVMVSSWE